MGFQGFSTLSGFKGFSFHYSLGLFENHSFEFVARTCRNEIRDCGCQSWLEAPTRKAFVGGGWGLESHPNSLSWHDGMTVRVPQPFKPGMLRGG